MKAPKYEFYIGKRYELYTWRTNTGIDTETGSETTDNALSAVSNSINVTDGQLIFTSLNDVANLSIFFYGNNSEYLGYKDSDIQQCLIAPPSGTKTFKMQINTAHSFYSQVISGTIYPTYIVDTISPIYKNLKKKYNRESGQQFFRETLEGDITLFRNDYEYVYNSPLETVFIFIITKYIIAAETYKIYFKGTFVKSDCTFDTSKETCVPEISPLDDYTEFLAAYEDTYNLISLAPATTRIYAYLRPIIQSYIRGGSTISYFFAGTYTEEDVLEVVDSPSTLRDTYHFAHVQSTNEVNISGADFDINGVYVGGGDTAKWTNKNGYYITASKTDWSQPEGVYYATISLYSPSGTLLGSNDVMQWTSIWHQGDEPGYYFLAGTPSFNLYEDPYADEPAKICTCSTFIEYHVYQRLLTNKAIVDDKSTYLIGASDMAMSNVNYKRCIGLAGGNYYHTIAASQTPTMFGRRSDGLYFTNAFIAPSAGRIRPLPVCRSTWGNSSIWFAFDESSYSLLDEGARTSIIIEDAYLIQNVISVLLSKVAPNVKHSGQAEYSRFLYDGNTPLGDMARFYTALVPKSNILNSNYDQPAQKAEISLKDVLDMLRQCFNCYWFISGGSLRIEHLSWFYNGGSYSTEPGLQFNITNIYDQFNGKKPEYFQTEVSFDKDLLVKRYEFGWMDDSTELFDRVTIDIKSNYVPQDKTEDITPSKFSTDIDYMLARPDDFSKDGFVLLMCTRSILFLYSVPIVQFSSIVGEDGLTFSSHAQNGYASWIYLSRFYMRCAPAQQAVINRLGPGLQFANSLIPCRTQDLRIITVEDPTIFGLVRTSQGDGIVDSVEVDLNSRVTEITLLYPPD